MAALGGIEFSVSHTTRARRPLERDGVDYHFVDDATFERMAAEGAFLEWAHVYGKRYGTSRAEVSGRLLAGTDVFFDIDVQGGRQLRERLDDVVLVYVLPPSLRVLEERLRARKSDADGEIAKRLELAKSEIEAASFYTHWIVNDDLDKAVRELSAIVVGERLRRVDKQDLVGQLLKGG